MNRREMMMSVGAIALAASTARADAPKPSTPGGAGGHEHHHGGPTPLSDAASTCVNTGTACLHHCIALLGSGDTTMAACASAVTDMLAQARALQDLALAASPFTPAAAHLMADIAKTCAAECRKHADKHPPCKACLDSCENLIKECAKV